MNSLIEEAQKIRDKHKDTGEHVKKLLVNLTTELEDLESKLETIENGMIVITFNNKFFPN